MVKDHYGVVIDSGSSGSRVQVYRWPDSAELVKESQDEFVNKSVPQIYQEESWNFKTSPGISTFGDKPEKVWDHHYEDLIEYAEKIIPKDNWEDTPIFVLATAGMRLLPEKKRQKLLKNICRDIKKHSDFLLSNCDEQIQIIDGETEGLYGWVGLNYLMGQLDNYDPNTSSHSSYGFMDMGGASTQISFVPNRDSEVEKHRDDISTLFLKNVNGDVQKWDLFVSTWLGFGANEARKRYLKNLINILPEKNNDDDEDDFKTTKVQDPCLPKGAVIDFYHHGHSYDIIGSGDYEQCLKTTYPLLLKNLPCVDEPCLFNGVHAPEIDFEKDKFVGISEYWYTANDVFHMGGEYNFLKFSEKVKLFCESDWSTIQQNSDAGEYNNLPKSLLTDACFKANWVLNVLHEGFNLPRAGIETKIPEETPEDFDNHIPFQSAGVIKGSELSWTLGRIVLYASSLITIGAEQAVGIQPSKNEHKPFITGGLTAAAAAGNKILSNADYDDLHIFPIFLALLALFTFLYFFFYKRQALNRFLSTMIGYLTYFITKVKAQYNQHKYNKAATQIQSDLESGIYSHQSLSSPSLVLNETSGRLSPSVSSADFNASLRTRSFANLPKGGGIPGQGNQQVKSGLRPVNSLLDFSSFKNDLRKSNSAGFNDD